MTVCLKSPLSALILSKHVYRGRKRRMKVRKSLRRMYTKAWKSDRKVAFSVSCGNGGRATDEDGSAASTGEGPGALEAGWGASTFLEAAGFDLLGFLGVGWGAEAAEGDGDACWCLCVSSASGLGVVMVACESVDGGTTGWEGGTATRWWNSTPVTSRLSDSGGHWEGVGDSLGVSDVHATVSHLCQKGSYSSLSLKLLRVSCAWEPSFTKLAKNCAAKFILYSSGHEIRSSADTFSLSGGIVLFLRRPPYLRRD